MTFSILDPIYKNIKLSYIAKIIIDKPEFQRLRYLKQLGTCNFVYPSVTHSRFEHSIGTYHLIDEITKHIYLNSEPYELSKGLKDIKELDKYYDKSHSNYNYEQIFEMVKIGGLCHDIGHGPYSHLFDEYLHNKLSSSFNYHEYRSIYLVEHIIKNDHILNGIFDNNDINFIKRIIDPSTTDNGWIYQIVSNSKNGVDMDKFDYITRDFYYLGIDNKFKCDQLIKNAIVIDNNICFPREQLYMLINMFNARKYLHKYMVNDPTIIASQYLVDNMIQEINGNINIISNIDKVEFFIRLTDDFILNYVNILQTHNIKINQNLIELNSKLSNRQYMKHHTTIYSSSELSNEQLQLLNPDNQYFIHKALSSYVRNSLENPLNKINLYKGDKKMVEVTEEMYQDLAEKPEYIYLFYKI